MHYITRKDAADAGASIYYPINSCKKGHKSGRYTSSGICCECNAEGVKSYNRRLRLIKNNRAAGFFVATLPPDHHFAALTFCRALDAQRGRAPTSGVSDANFEPTGAGVGVFAYDLHPDDHPAVGAFCRELEAS